MTEELSSLNCVLDHLTQQDDAEAWKAILRVIGEEFVARYQASPRGKRHWFLRIGVCSHWWRPHQFRWEQAGGFAAPIGYSGNRSPEVDWSVVIAFDGKRWKQVEGFPSNKYIALRVALPARTARHKQAAVHTSWSTSHKPVFYGFRNIDGTWICVAASDEHERGRIIDAR